MENRKKSSKTKRLVLMRFDHKSKLMPVVKENESDARKKGEVDSHKEDEVGKNSQPSSEKPIEEQNNAHTESFETPYYEF